MLGRNIQRFYVVSGLALCLLAIGLFFDLSSACGVDRLKVDMQGETRTHRGRLVTSGDPNTLLLLHEDNRLQKISGSDVLGRESDESGFEKGFFWDFFEKFFCFIGVKSDESGF